MGNQAPELKLNSDGGIRAAFTLLRKDGDSGRPLRVGYSTNAVDRDRDVIDVRTLRRDNYRKNPVVLWMHDRMQPPIARSLDEVVETVDGMDVVFSTPAFTDRDEYEFGALIGRLVTGRFINTASIGFMPDRDPVRTVWVEERGGYNFINAEQYEYSFTTIPANQTTFVEHAKALVLRAKAAGVDVSGGDEWAAQTLDLRDEIHRRAFAKALWDTSPRPTYSLPPAAPADRSIPVDIGALKALEESTASLTKKFNPRG